MVLKLVNEKLNECKLKFTELTFFLPNYIKMDLHTRFTIAELIDENGKLDDMKVIIDYDLEPGIVCVGMGQGPTTSTIKIF